MYRFKHVAISNVCEESPTRPRFFLPAVVRMTFTLFFNHPHTTFVGRAYHIGIGLEAL